MPKLLNSTLFTLTFFAIHWALCILSIASPPNIVLIVSDDQHWGDYQFMGNSQLQTPNLDQLAAESLVYRRGYVPSSLCCPSLATILTGLFPHQNKITCNDPPIPPGIKPGTFHQSEAFRDGRTRMNEFMQQADTLPKLLATKGYRSLQTGKWWQGHFSTGGFTDGMTQGDRHGDAGLDIGRKTMKPIEDFIGSCQSEEKPFLIWYAPFLPHSPHNPPKKILDESRKRWKTGDEVAQGPYLASIEWFDQTIGSLMNILREKKVDENTLIIYVTDNGWISGDKLNQFAPRSKQSPYDGGLRTPIMLRWPKHIAPRIAPEAVSSIDIAPTVLAAIGLDKPSAMQGIDLLDTKAVSERKAIYGECFTHNAVDINNPAANLRWRWTISGDYKLIVPAPQNERDGKTELYHITADPFEKEDLAAKMPDLIEKMQEELDDWYPGN